MKYGKIIFFFPILNKGGLEEVAKILINFFLKKNLKIELITSSKKTIKISHKNLKIFSPISNGENVSNVRKIINCGLILNRRLKNNNQKESIVLSLQNSVISIIISKFNGFKIVVKNANPVKGFLLTGNRIINLFTFVLKIIFYNLSDKIIVNSEYNKKTLSTFIFNKKKIFRIYNPIKLNNKIIKKRKKNLILYVGRVVKEKGLLTLIKAFKMISNKNYKLLIVGDGSYKKDLKLFVKSEKLSNRISFVGWVNNPQQYYCKSKILVLPTLFEAFGNVLVEGMHSGVACIATRNSGGPDEILANGKYGYQFEKNNFNDLKEKINFCILNKEITNNKILLAKKSLAKYSTLKSLDRYYRVICD